MTKVQLRNDAKLKLKALSRDEKQHVEQKLVHNLLTSKIWMNAKTIGITISRGTEWETRGIIEEGWKDNKQMVVPKCFPSEKQLQFFQIQSFNQLEVVYYNLLEPNPKETRRVSPSEIDLLIVPGLLFDAQGYRIGFGGGYYDRFLSNYTGVTASLVSQIQQIESLPIESFDQPVQYLITEAGVYQTKA